MLDIAVCTMGTDGISRFARANHPSVPGVRYVVSWQRSADIPVPEVLADREDVMVVRTDSIGLSANRNNALAACSAPVVLIADDDIQFFTDGLLAIINTFDSNPTLDVATFILDRPDGPAYPEISVRLGHRLPKGYWPSSCEIAFRRLSLNGIRFDTRLGLGAPCMTAGEDELLLLQCRRSGLCCRFFPITIARHPHASTGTGKKMSPSTLRATGCIIALEYGIPQAFLRIPLKAWRLSRRQQASFLHALPHLFKGLVLSRRFKTVCRP